MMEQTEGGAMKTAGFIITVLGLCVLWYGVGPIGAFGVGLVMAGNVFYRHADIQDALVRRTDRN
jgi:hypothetical protein